MNSPPPPHPPHAAHRAAARWRPRVLIALALGAVLATLWPTPLPLVTRLLLGWNVGVWTYVLLVLAMMSRADARQLQRRALGMGDGMPVVLMLAATGALAILAALVTEMSQVRHGSNVVSGWPYLVLALATVAGTWLLLPIEFALAYSRLYHRGAAAPHGLEFPGEDKDLDYWDFLYFSITVAATSQTSDVVVSSRHMRRLVMIQALLSFVFNTGVLALSINLLASLMG